MDGKSFAKQFVQDGRDGANVYRNSEGKLKAGIQGLTAFDPSKVAAFDASLDHRRHLRAERI